MTQIQLLEMNLGVVEATMRRLAAQIEQSADESNLEDYERCKREHKYLSTRLYVARHNAAIESGADTQREAE